MRNGSGPRLWLLLPALFALAWFWPVLAHGFRSDDFEAVYYLDRETGAVRWARVLEEWARPWFGVRDLYRPLVSLSLGLNWACGSTPFGFHLLNLLLLAGTATCVAATAARLVCRRRALVGVFAGALVVLHPAAVEPTAWIMARTTGLQVCCSALACWGFVRWRDGDGRAWLPWCATVLACASKEGAVLLPFSFVALDLLRGSRPRWRAHAPFFALVAGYLVLRRALLGCFTTAEEGHTIGERVGGALDLFGQLTVPPLDGHHCLGGVWFLGLFLLVGQSLWGAGSRRALWCVPWALLLLTPGTTHLGAAANALAGRFVFDAVPALALFVAFAVAGSAARRLGPLRTGLGVLGVLGIALGLGIGSRGWIARYDADSRLIGRAQQELIASAQDAAPDRPFGVIGLPGQPLLHPELWGFLTLRPFAPRDLPVVGLTNVLTRNPATPELFGDASVVHALVAHGAGVGVWDEKAQRLVPVAAAAPGTVDFVQDPNDPHRFLPPRPLPPTAVAQLEVRAPEAAAPRRWEIAILGNLQGEYSARPVQAGSGADGAVAFAGMVHVLPWLVAATMGGSVPGISLTCAGALPPAGTVVRAHARLARLALPPLPGGPVARAGLGAVIAPPRLPEARFRRYLLLPTGVYSWTAPVGSEGLPAPIADQVIFAADLLGSCPASWCFVEEAGAPGAPLHGTAFGSALVR